MMGRATGYYSTRGSPKRANVGVCPQPASGSKRKHTATTVRPSTQDGESYCNSTSLSSESTSLLVVTDDGVDHQSDSGHKSKRTSHSDAGPSSEPDYPSLSDTSMLDCPICFNSLTVPVYQCPNGHLFCSSCHQNLKHKCPSCSRKLGNLRNRAIESVLESLMVSCIYKIHGCTEKISYSDKASHEECCNYGPRKCPFDDCGFFGYTMDMYTHLEKKHTTSVVHFKLDELCKFPWVKDDESIVLLEKKPNGDNGAIFILNMVGEDTGINCIKEANPSMDFYKYEYSLHTFLKGSPVKGSLTIDSVTSPFYEFDGNNVGTDYPFKDFLQALEYFLDYEEPELGVLMKSVKDTPVANTTEGIGQEDEFSTDTNRNGDARQTGPEKAS